MLDSGSLPWRRLVRGQPARVSRYLDVYLKQRGQPTVGPLFITARKARSPRRADLTADGYARLSYRQADTLWKKYTPGWDLHQLRHTAISARAAQGYTEVELKRFRGTSRCAASTGAVLGEAFGNPSGVVISADGAYLGAGAGTVEVCLWRLADRTLQATLRGHDGTVWDASLSADGRLVASRSPARHGQALERGSGNACARFGPIEGLRAWISPA